MKRLISFFPPGLLLAGVFVFALASGAPAQQQRGRREAEAGKKAVREQTDKEVGEEVGKEEQAAKKKERAEAGQEARAKAKQKYVPRGLKEEELREWKDGIPPGWTKGEKKGWGEEGVPPGKRRGAEDEARIRKAYPPAAKDWGKREKEDWERRLERARERVRDKARRTQGALERDTESAEISLEEAARAGVPIEHAEEAVGKALEAGMKGPEIEQMTRAMAYGEERDIDSGEIGAFARERIEAGERGEELALSIYREIDRREAERPLKPEKPQEEKKTSWWQRIFKRE